MSLHDIRLRCSSGRSGTSRAGQGDMPYPPDPPRNAGVSPSGFSRARVVPTPSASHRRSVRARRTWTDALLMPRSLRANASRRVFRRERTANRPDTAAKHLRSAPRRPTQPCQARLTSSPQGVRVRCRRQHRKGQPGNTLRDPPRTRGAHMFERFTDRARRVVVLAQEEARMLNHNYIGTEHILLGPDPRGRGRRRQGAGVPRHLAGGRAPAGRGDHRPGPAGAVRAHPVHPARQEGPRAVACARRCSSATTTSAPSTSCSA